MDAYMHACIQKHMHYRMIISNIMSMPNCDDTTMKLCYVIIVEDRYCDTVWQICKFHTQPFHVLMVHHDDIIKWKHFPYHWPFVRGIYRSTVDSTHKGQWTGALMFSLICAWTNDWANNRDAGYLRCYHAHYDVTVMELLLCNHWSHRMIYSNNKRCEWMWLSRHHDNSRYAKNVIHSHQSAISTAFLKSPVPWFCMGCHLASLGVPLWRRS